MVIIAYKIIKENPPDFFSDKFGENKKNIPKKSGTKNPSLKAILPINATTYPLVYESFIRNIQQPISSKNLYRGKSEAFFENYLKPKAHSKKSFS